MIPAGTFLDRAGVPAATAANVFGILAYDTDATAATSGTVYLTGSFLRDRIVAANPAATIDAAYRGRASAQGDLLRAQHRDVNYSGANWRPPSFSLSSDLSSERFIKGGGLPGLL